MNKKLIISLSTIAAVAIVAVGATTAYFGNTETSTGNMFIAGAIDLKVDNECHYNGAACVCDPRNPTDCHWQICNEEGTACQSPGEACSCTWGLSDLDGKAIFYFDDVKPGDDGEDTISLHVDSNPAWICAEISNVTSTENGCNVPEGIVDTTCGDPGVDEGELWENLYFDIWMDDNCDNVWQDGELVLIEGAGAAKVKWAIADSQTGYGPIRDACIGVAWYVPDQVGNEIQGDSVSGDIAFYAYQARNNDDFVCYPPPLYCGDGIITGDEECELPGTPDCTYCSQSTSQCDDHKTQTRDEYGDCDLYCGCVEDPWSEPVCVVGSCGAECVVDADCDDQDPNTTDTCNADCQCENIYVPSCGNGIEDEGEECDDGNNEDNDGCSAICKIEYCGDGIKQTSEECDDDNNDSGDGCDAYCIIEYCGDGIVNNVDEVCDDNDMNGQPGYCNADCTGPTPYCGDGTVNQPSEECDDGNTSSNDYCSASCKKQAKITVTKGVTNNDGGNLNVGDFSLLVDTTGVTSGVPIYVLVGSHTVSEVGQYGYLATISGDCASNGDITLAWEDDKSCNINNDDIAPIITVKKTVVGGSAAPDDFDVSIDHVIKTSGSSNPVTANTAHIIDEETMVSGYGFTSLTGTSFLGVSCPAVLEGTITLLPGDVVTCTITNTYE